MHKHHGRHNDPTHHAYIMMHGGSKKYAAGGGPSNTMSGNTPIYKKGGKAHRAHHDAGDMVNPVTGTTSPDILARRKGGRACHAEGDVVATPLKKGGKPAHRRRKKAEGDEVRSFTAMAPRLGLSRTLSEGGDAKEALKRGGKAHHKKRKHHSEGDEVETMSHGGRKKKKVGREHHNFGDDVGDFFKNALNTAVSTAPMWLPALLKEGGTAETKLAEGGVGKIRRGMMSKKGKILKAPIHARSNMKSLRKS